MADGMRLLFVDIDGVLANERTAFEPGVLDRYTVALLNAIIVETEARVVISSSWRYAYDYGELCRIFYGHGFVGDIVGITPIIADSRATRGEEIVAWLDNWNKPYGDTKIIGVVILDDDPNVGVLKKYLVQTGYQRGLEAKHMEKAIAMFKEQEATWAT